MEPAREQLRGVLAALGATNSILSVGKYPAVCTTETGRAFKVQTRAALTLYVQRLREKQKLLTREILSGLGLKPVTPSALKSGQRAVRLFPSSTTPTTTATATKRAREIETIMRNKIDSSVPAPATAKRFRIRLPVPTTKNSTMTDSLVSTAVAPAVANNENEAPAVSWDKEWSSGLGLNSCNGLPPDENTPAAMSINLMVSSPATPGAAIRRTSSATPAMGIQMNSSVPQVPVALPGAVGLTSTGVAWHGAGGSTRQQQRQPHQQRRRRPSFALSSPAAQATHLAHQVTTNDHHDLTHAADDSGGPAWSRPVRHVDTDNGGGGGGNGLTEGLIMGGLLAGVSFADDNFSEDRFAFNAGGDLPGGMLDGGGLKYRPLIGGQQQTGPSSPAVIGSPALLYGTQQQEQQQRQHGKGVEDVIPSSSVSSSDFPSCIVTTVVQTVGEQERRRRPSADVTLDTLQLASCSAGAASGSGSGGGLPALCDGGNGGGGGGDGGGGGGGGGGVDVTSWAEVKKNGARELEVAAAATFGNGGTTKAASSRALNRRISSAAILGSKTVGSGSQGPERTESGNKEGGNNTDERVVKGCREMGCRRRPLYAFKGARKAIRCPLHRLEEMVNVRHPLCQHESCFRQPSFGIEGDQRASFCSEHRLPNMVNVSSRRCRAPQCLRHPNFGYPGDRRASFCCGHKAPGMVDVVSRRCQHPECARRPLYAMVGQRASFCSAHKDPGMIDVVSSRCQFEGGCNRHPSFGWRNVDGKARRCAHHRLQGMESVKVHRRTNTKPGNKK